MCFTDYKLLMRDKIKSPQDRQSPPNYSILNMKKVAGLKEPEQYCSHKVGRLPG